MKRLLLMACCTCIAFFQSTAQTNTTTENQPMQDTLMILLPEGNKLMLTGKPMKALLQYTRADSLKQLFTTDYEKAVKTNTLPADAPLIHYFVHPGGKRRIKAESEETADNKIDVSYEIKRLNLDLPKFRYLIHDLESETEIQIYLQNPEQLISVLTSINLSDAIKAAGKEKRSFRKFVKTELTPDQSQFKVADVKGSLMQYIELNPVIGVGLIGNTLTPVLAADIYYRSTNKYGINRLKIGYSLSAFPITTMAGGEITKISYVKGHEIRFLKNLSSSTRGNELWMGVQLGMLTSSTLNTFNNAYKAGLIFKGSGPFGYSLDCIRDNHKNTVFGFTARLEF